MSLKEDLKAIDSMQLRQPSVSVVGVGLPSLPTASEGRTPTLLQRATELMNRQYDEHVEYLRVQITDVVMSRATERRLKYDVKKAIGKKFSVEVQPEVMKRMYDWLRSEGFTELTTVGELRAKQGRQFNPHNDVNRGYSAETFLLEW